MISLHTFLEDNPAIILFRDDIFSYALKHLKRNYLDIL